MTPTRTEQDIKAMQEWLENLLPGVKWERQGEDLHGFTRSLDLSEVEALANMRDILGSLEWEFQIRMGQSSMDSGLVIPGMTIDIGPRKKRRDEYGPGEVIPD